MCVRPNRNWMGATALLAAAALLFIASAAAIPGPWHDGLPGRSCDICRSGHLPTVAPLVRVLIQAPVAVEWHVPIAEQRLTPAPIFRSGFPRAPPA